MRTGRYWETIRKKLADFCRPGDSITCVEVFPRPDSTCQLCGKYPIKWNYVLRNARTSRELAVGSNCIHNHKLIIEEWGYDGTVDFLPQYHRAVEFINQKYPRTAKITFPTLSWN